MSQEIGKSAEKEPPIQEIPKDIIEKLIYGYTRLNFNKDSEEKISSDIIELFEKFYQKESYNFHMIILNNKPFKLALCDVSSNNNYKILNLKNDIKSLSNKVRGIGYKENFDIFNNLSKNIINELDININNNNKYNAIFTLQGKGFFDYDDIRNINEQFSDDITDCKLLLLNCNTNDLYYYQLPDLSFGDIIIENNNPIYSKNHGLIVIGPSTPYDDENNIINFATLNLNKNYDDNKDDDDNNNDLKWKYKKDLKKLININWTYSPNYCFIDKNETEIFIINGGQNKTIIYNIETNQVKELENNRWKDNKESVVWYNNTKNRVWTIGDDDKTDVYFFDLEYNWFSSNLPRLKKEHIYQKSVKLWTDESGVIIHIGKSYKNKNIYYEWIDDREKKKQWYVNENLDKTLEKLSNDEQFKYTNVVSWM